MGAYTFKMRKVSFAFLVFFEQKLDGSNKCYFQAASLLDIVA